MQFSAKATLYNAAQEKDRAALPSPSLGRSSCPAFMEDAAFQGRPLESCHSQDEHGKISINPQSIPWTLLNATCDRKPDLALPSPSDIVNAPLHVVHITSLFSPPML